MLGGRLKLRNYKYDLCKLRLQNLPVYALQLEAQSSFLCGWKDASQVAEM